MKAKKGSRPQPLVKHLQDPVACALVCDRAWLALLAKFVHQERSVASVATELGAPITATYKRIKKLEDLGLVAVNRLEARAGRATRHYKAVAQHFFVPFRVFPPELVSRTYRQQGSRLFRQGLDRLYRQERMVENRWGMQTQIADNGEPYLQIVDNNDTPWAFAHPDAPAVVSGWNAMYLSHAEAKSFQLEVLQLMQRYIGKNPSRARRKFMTGLFLVDVQGL